MGLQTMMKHDLKTNEINIKKQKRFLFRAMWKRNRVCKGPSREGNVWTGQYFSFRNVWGNVRTEAKVTLI